MANYTKLNLTQDVEDMAPRFGYAEHMEARYARKALGLEQSGVSYYKLQPGYRVPFGHRHGEQEEVYLVVSGSARFKLEDDVVELSAFDAVRVPGATPRGMEAGPDGLRSSPSALRTPTTRTPRCSRAGGPRAVSGALPSPTRGLGRARCA